VPVRNIALTFFAAIALLASRAHADQPRKLSDVHTIAIIAAMGDKAELTDVGWLTGGGRSTIDVSGWGLDDLVTRDIAAALQGTYTIKAAAYDHAAYASPGGDFIGNGPIFDLIAARNDRALVDAYVVIYPIGDGDPITHLKQQFKGLGMYNAPLMFHHTVFDYALYEVEVIDSITCKTIARNMLILGYTKFLDQVVTWNEAYGAVMPPSVDAMTDAQVAAFRGRATKLIDASIKPTLAQLGLIPGAPMAVPEDIHIPKFPVR
jgi:hypothetical protein